MKNRKNASWYVRSVVGTIILMFLLNAILLPLPVGAADLKRDTKLSKSYASFIGEAKVDYSGCSVAIAGDVNGDGYDDLLIGAYGNSDAGSNAGQVYLILGGPSGWNDGVTLDKASASFQGENQDDYAGTSVAGAGDVNGDGFDDILIGAYGNDWSNPDAGQVYLIFGKATGWNMDTTLGKADASFVGTNKADNLGHSLAGVGDVNNDGFDDFVMGAYLNDAGGIDSGQAYLFLGKQAGWFMQQKITDADASYFGPWPGEEAGWSLAGAGDVNRDGYDDFLIGAPWDNFAYPSAGAAYLILGKANGWSFGVNLKSADASWTGEATNDLLGFAVAGAGDVNGDGFDDILIGAILNDVHGLRLDAGQTYLILGKPVGWVLWVPIANSDASFWGEQWWDNSGGALSTAGDLNGDGYDDFMIGAEFNSDGTSNAGQTYIIMGRPAGWAMNLDLRFFADASYIGEYKGEYSGYALSGGGDVNGDGVPDFMIGALCNGDNQEGKTYVFLTFSAPPVADNLKGTSANDASSITLTWTDPAFWNEPISGIRIYKSTDGSNYKHIGTAAPGDQKFSDQDVIFGRTYYYAVVTVDGNGALSGLGAPVAVLCDKDTDGDGFSDAIDADDDGDGIPDFSDAFPLDAKEWLDTDLDGTGNNKDTDDDNDGILDVNDAEPLNPLNGIQGDINFLNTTVKKVGIDVANMRTELNLMNGNITALGTDIDTMGTSLTAMINALGSELEGMNDTVQAQIGDLGTDLQGVNASVKKDIASMATELHSFRLETSASLKEIKDLLAKHDKDMKGETANLNKTINALETKNLAQIMGELTIIEAELKALGINDTELMTKITETKASIAGFKTSTDSKLGNITTDLGKLDTIQTSINDLKKTQKTTNNNVAANGTNDMVMMALIALVIVLVIVAIVTGMKKKKA